MMLCGLCAQEAPRIVTCADCEAGVGGCCLSVDGLCIACAEAPPLASSRQHTAAELRSLALEIARGWTSDAVTLSAARLVQRWRREVKEEQR